MENFIEQQQELARKKLQAVGFTGKMAIHTSDLDTIITQIITNTGEELLRLAEGERKKKNSIKHFSGNGYYNQQGHNQAIDTLKKHITNVTGVK